jgi:hypothetical protein
MFPITRWNSITSSRFQGVVPQQWRISASSAIPATKKIELVKGDPKITDRHLAPNNAAFRRPLGN